MKIYYINSNTTGGHWALKTSKSSKPFENPMSVCKLVTLYENDIVADIDAYVGEYSLYAVNQGVKKVLSYEPTPNTFKILNKNKKPNMEIYNKAVVGDNSDFVNLYISSGIGVTNSIAKKDRKKGKIKVPAIKYKNALNNATVVKIDVEGAEYQYNIIQPQLRAVILEFHPLVKQPWQDYANSIIYNIEKAGFKPLHRPKFKHGWDLIGAWEK